MLMRRTPMKRSAWPRRRAGVSLETPVAPRPGIEGCHARFDQYRLLPGGRDAHAAAGERWAARTREVIEPLVPSLSAHD